MVSTKWMQGKNELVVYNDDMPVGTGKLLLKDGRYFIEDVCVLKEYRGNHYGDLIIRMLVRRAVNLGADKTYAEVNKELVKMFNKIGFESIGSNNELHIMVKNGDVGGHCN